MKCLKKKIIDFMCCSYLTTNYWMCHFRVMCMKYCFSKGCVFETPVAGRSVCNGVKQLEQFVKLAVVNEEGYVMLLLLLNNAESSRTHQSQC